MTKPLIITIVIAVIAFLAGYLLGNVLPFSGFSGTGNKSGNVQPTLTDAIPSNKGRLNVTVKNTLNEPIIGIEIDVATEPGPPPDWGVQEADTNGSVKYDLDPGTYYVFFNMNRFPNEYVVQPEKQVTVTAGQQSDVSFVLEKK